jgi:hypothetical protein
MAESHNKTLIFVETKRKADDLQRRMQREGLVQPDRWLILLSVTIPVLLLVIYRSLQKALFLIWSKHGIFAEYAGGQLLQYMAISLSRNVTGFLMVCKLDFLAYFKHTLKTFSENCRILELCSQLPIGYY